MDGTTTPLSLPWVDFTFEPRKSFICSKVLTRGKKASKPQTEHKQKPLHLALQLGHPAGVPSRNEWVEEPQLAQKASLRARVCSQIKGGSNHSQCYQETRSLD